MAGCYAMPIAKSNNNTYFKHNLTTIIFIIPQKEAFPKQAKHNPALKLTKTTNLAKFDIYQTGNILQCNQKKIRLFKIINQTLSIINK